MNRLLLAAVLVLLVILVALVGFRKWSRTKVPPANPAT